MPNGINVAGSSGGGANPFLAALGSGWNGAVGAVKNWASNLNTNNAAPTNTSWMGNALGGSQSNSPAAPGLNFPSSGPLITTATSPLKPSAGPTQTQTAASSGLPSKTVGAPFTSGAINAKKSSPISLDNVPQGGYTSTDPSVEAKVAAMTANPGTAPNTPLANAANGSSSTSSTTPPPDTTTDGSSYLQGLANLSKLAVPGADELALTKQIADIDNASANAQTLDATSEPGGTYSGYLAEATAQQQALAAQKTALTNQLALLQSNRQNAYTIGSQQLSALAPQKDSNGNMIALNPTTGRYEMLFQETAPASINVVSPGSSLVTTQNGQITSQTGGSNDALASLDQPTQDIVNGLASNLGQIGQGGEQFKTTVGTALANGDLAGAQSAVETALPSTVAPDFQTNKQYLTSLSNLKTAMDAYYAKGNATGWAQGTAEGLLEKGGTSWSQDAVNLSKAIQDLNPTAQGATYTNKFSAPTAAEISSELPSLSQSQANNNAAFIALQNLISGNQKTILTTAIGPTAYNAIYGGGSGASNTSQAASGDGSGGSNSAFMNLMLNGPTGG